MAVGHEGLARGQPGATDPDLWAGLPNTDLDPIWQDSGLGGFSLDDGACALFTVLLNLQTQATFDSTILPLYMPGVGLGATAASGAFEPSLAPDLPLISAPTGHPFRKTWPHVCPCPPPSGCLDWTFGPFFRLVFWWN